MAGTVTNRFALSALSRKFKANSIPEEIMLHKETGQMLIRTTSGDVISYDYLTRLKGQEDAVTLMAYNMDISGDLYSLDFDDRELPEILTENTNLLSAPLTITNNYLKKIMISVDVDVIEKGEIDKITTNEPWVQIDFKATYNASTITKTFKLQLSEMNSRVILASEIVPSGSDNYKIEITGITITRDNADVGKTMKMIIQSIYTIVERSV